MIQVTDCNNYFVAHRNGLSSTKTAPQIHNISPAETKVPSDGGMEDILSTSEGGAIGTIAGTPETKYGG